MTDYDKNDSLRIEWEIMERVKQIHESLIHPQTHTEGDQYGQEEVSKNKTETY